MNRGSGRAGEFRPKSSTLVAIALVTVTVLLIAAAVALDRSVQPTGGKTVVTIRLWDESIADTYRESFKEFSRAHPETDVRISVVAYANYFDTLRTDVVGGSAPDIFWLSSAYLAGYTDSGRLMNIDSMLGADAVPTWDPLVVGQFTRDDVLWGVPQLTDGGIAVYYNADLLASAGIDPAQLADLRWNPLGDDTLRPLLARLTVDADGHTADTPGFDPRRVRQWGYNAANDPQGIYLNYIGSAGGTFQTGDRFTFYNPGAIEAFSYLVGLINQDHVAPPASDTNDNGDFSRNQFVAGKMALFQSGTYNLAQVEDHARFHWGVAMLPSGPNGRVSVANGIAAVGNSASAHPYAVREVLAWMGSAVGNEYLGRHGTAIPAVRAAQRVYFDYWAAKGVDVTPFFAVLDGPRIPAPGGAGFAAGYEAFQPYFDDMFLGEGGVVATLRQAQAAANAAARR